MALYNALINYKKSGILRWFDMLDKTKAKVRLNNGKEVIVYMANQYIVGESDVVAAKNAPPAEYFIYNDWDNVTAAAEEAAVRYGIKVMKYGRFFYELESLNDKP